MLTDDDSAEYEKFRMQQSIEQTPFRQFDPEELDQKSEEKSFDDGSGLDEVDAHRKMSYDNARNEYLKEGALKRKKLQSENNPTSPIQECAEEFE